MGRSVVFTLLIVCATRASLGGIVEYEATADTAVIRQTTGLMPSTPTSGFGVTLSGNAESKKFKLAVPAKEFHIEVVIPSAEPYQERRYLTVTITNPTTTTSDACKVVYKQFDGNVMVSLLVRPTGIEEGSKALSLVSARNVFVAKFGVKSNGEAVPHEGGLVCKYSPYNNAPDFNDKKMIEIELKATNFPPNSEINFPADVDFLAPKAPTTTTTTTTAMTTEAPKPTVPEDAPGDEDDEDSTAAVAKASAGKIVAIVIPIVLVVIVLLVIVILLIVGILKREKLMAWYANRRNREKPAKKDTPGTTGASEDQQDDSRSVMSKDTTVKQTSVEPSAKEKTPVKRPIDRNDPRFYKRVDPNYEPIYIGNLDEIKSSR